MRLTFLGTGTSTGVPSIGCDCEVCLSDNPRDKRLRTSILIEHGGKSLLVDTSSDFRQQALRVGLKRLDDIRPLNFRHGAMPVFANEIAWKDLRRIFQYIFNPTHIGGGLPQLIPHIVHHGAAFSLGEDLHVTPLEVIHGNLRVIAYRFNDFAYATDLSEMPKDTIEALRGLDVLVLDGLRFKEHSTHLNVERSLEYIAELKPRRAYLTHMNHEVLYERDSKLLPKGVEFAYDGLVLSDEL